MTKRRVWRYKCDFCNKANCSRASISRHERTCTNNPGRACGFCAHVQQTPTPLPALIAIMNGATSENGGQLLERLKQRAKCPACTLAALRQSGAFGGRFAFTFDYHAEAQKFWDRYDKEEQSW